ncbi:TPA: SUF system NifU family Fe-S cluster assembly protein [Candidatus Woesearchaeota archaeon]|nr:SUF system NifU family Fe-S cluster assembly protein [Candidatus Woesearchaeota archaeon]
MEFFAEDMYRENIMDHFKNPRNHGVVENPDIGFADNNPLCGDEIGITVKLNKDKNEKPTIAEIKFNGKGCAISQASASMLTEQVVGMRLEDVKKMKTDEVIKNLGIPLQPIRVKCAILGFKVLEAGIFLYEGKKVSGK